MLKNSEIARVKKVVYLRNKSRFPLVESMESQISNLVLLKEFTAVFIYLNQILITFSLCAKQKPWFIYLNEIRCNSAVSYVKFT